MQRLRDIDAVVRGHTAVITERPSWPPSSPDLCLCLCWGRSPPGPYSAACGDQVPGRQDGWLYNQRRLRVCFKYPSWVPGLSRIHTPLSKVCGDAPAWVRSGDKAGATGLGEPVEVGVAPGGATVPGLIPEAGSFRPPLLPIKVTLSACGAWSRRPGLLSVCWAPAPSRELSDPFLSQTS